MISKKPTNAKKQKQTRHNKKKNSTHVNTVSVTIIIEYVEAKIIFFCQKKKKKRVQSYAAQEGPKYRGQWKNGS